MATRDDEATDEGIGGRDGGARRRPASALAGLLVVWAFAGLATGVGAPAAGPPAGPRSAEEIATALGQGPHAGECERCHAMHAGGSIPLPYALVGRDDNSLCDRCHTGPFTSGSYGGPLAYAGSAHGASPATIWPGPDPPARLEAGAAGKCVNCHDAHGRSDGAGPLPALGVAREERACLACHDGGPAASDVRSQMMKAFRHPGLDVSGRHAGPLEAEPAEFGTTPLNRRHAECEDCHNPHLARADDGLPDPLRPSNTVLGASRVIPLNGPAGTAPAFTFVAGSDTVSGPPEEYQLCFKCHSSWTTQPAGQTDLARALNPANASYHPVEAPGRNPGIAPGAFVAGWSAFSRTRCGDCHGDDFDAAAGPHGSNHRHILKRPYDASPAPRTSTPDELCFACHAFATYADPGAPVEARAASRFNAPGTAAGHAEHVGGAQVPCASCHVTHGAASQPHLLVTGRTPGLVAYTQAPDGGSCASSCHADASYTVTYAR